MTDLPAELDEDLIWRQRLAPPRAAPALFLDRDGVIVEEVHYLHQVEKTRLINGIVAAINFARARGWHVVVVTNQAGIGRGLFDWSAYREVHDHIIAALAALNVTFDAVLACPYTPTGIAPYVNGDHPARKPNPGMLLKAAEDLHIDLAQSWIVGDRAGDLLAGRNAGIAGGILVATGFGAEQRGEAEAVGTKDYPVHFAASIADIPGIISQQTPG